MKSYNNQNKNNHHFHQGIKISIDGSADNKIKLEKTENPRPAAHSINKISIISRPKDKRVVKKVIVR